MNHSNMHSVSPIQDLSGTLIKIIFVMLIGNIIWLVFPLKTYLLLKMSCIEILHFLETNQVVCITPHKKCNDGCHIS